MGLPHRPHSIAIAGCGIGGLAAALFLARAGHRVVMFERFAHAQPVGSGLMVQPTGLAVLDALGLGNAIRTLAAPIAGLHGIAVNSGRRALAMDFAALGSGVTAYGTHRTLLFQTLYDAVLAAGVEIETSKAISTSEAVSGGQRRLAFADGKRSTAFDLVIDAMGARSPLSRASDALAYGALWTTLDWVDDPRLLPDRLDQRYAHAGKMAGIMPIGRSPAADRPSAAYFWSLKGAHFEDWKTQGIARWKDEALKLWPDSEAIVGQIQSADQFVHAQYRHRTLSSPIARGLVHVGDAWHATSPQLGQGANMALLDAAALNWAMVHENSIPNALSAYARARHFHVHLYQAMSFAFTPLYQSDSLFLPWCRDLIVSRFSDMWPARGIIARLVAGQIVPPFPFPVEPAGPDPAAM